MEDLSFELNAPENLKSKQTGSRKKFPELSSKTKAFNKENKKPTKSIKLLEPNDEYKKFLTKKTTKTIKQSMKSLNVDVKSKPQGTAKKVDMYEPKRDNNAEKIKASNEKETIEKSNKKENGENVKKGNLEKYKKENSNKNTNIKASANVKSTGYVSSNESYKMSTTYEFSGNSKDDSGNLSDDSLVKIFKSKLPTSVKIDRILTPRVNNLKGSSIPQKTDKEEPLPKSKKLTFTAEKPRKPSKYDHIRQSDTGRNSAGFNTFATPLKTTQTKISTPTESEANPWRIAIEKKCVQSHLARNEKPLDPAKENGGKRSLELKVSRATRNTSKRKILSPLGVDQQENSLFSTISNKSSLSKNSSLFSSLSPSPQRKDRSSLLSTMSMESKESHDSSGSVYISATDSFTSTTDSKAKLLDYKNKVTKKEKQISVEADPCPNEKRPEYPGVLVKNSGNSCVTVKAPFSTDVRTKDFGDLNENPSHTRGPSGNSRFSARRLRSMNKGDNSSLFSSITSNESIKENNLHSKLRDEKSCSLISGIEQLNLTESEKIPTRSQNDVLRVSRTSLVSELSNCSSLFSSINTNTSKAEEKLEKPRVDDVISISSDSSFDIDDDFEELKRVDKSAAVLCEESKSCNKSDQFGDSAPSKPRHSSLYSTLGNFNLTSGVKIRKSKYFFNSSDKSISSISEPSCIDSSILPSTKRSVFDKINETVEANGTHEDDAPHVPQSIYYDASRGVSDVLKPTSGVSSDTNARCPDSGKKVLSELKQKKEDSKCTGQKERNIDDIFDKTKVFNGDKWVNKFSEESSFQFKGPKNHLIPSEGNEKVPGHDNIDLSSWGTNSRGDIKIKVDRYSLSFNFNKLMGGKPDTTSTETGHDHLSSDVKHCADLKKRKSINRDLRKSIEIKRSVVISSDSDADTDDEIRVVSKAKRKQRILDSDTGSSGETSDQRLSGSSGHSDYEDIRPRDERKTKKLLHGLTSDFNEILKINKKATTKDLPCTPKRPPPVKKPKGKAASQLTAVPNTPYRTDKVSKKNRLTFLSSLSAIIPDGYIAHPEAAVYKTKFKSKKEELSRRLFHLYNKEVFDDRLPSDMPLEWNGRMRTTSGFCYNKRTRSLDPGKEDVRSARIALSKKILDTPDRLRDTLIHELCHAASWLIDGMRDGHGPNWKKWTIYAMQRFPELPPIKRCHDYKIDTKYVYRCSQCDYEFGRHSKSLNLERQVCGYCHGKFILLTNSRGGQAIASDQAPKRPPTQFAMFVKENYAKVKQGCGGLKHGEVMKELSRRFAEAKLKDA